MFSERFIMSDHLQPYSFNQTNLHYGQLQSTNTDSNILSGESSKQLGTNRALANSEPTPVPNRQRETEGFDSSTMRGDLTGTPPSGTPNLLALKDTLRADARYDHDLSGNMIRPPNSYGYIPSLQEVRNQDTTDLLSQENTTFALAALSGASIFVLGIMILSRANVSPSM